LTWTDIKGQEGSDDLSSEFVVTGLLPNTVYRFRVRARNAHGWSLLYSEVLEALTSMWPEAPAPVTTTVRDLNVRVSWETPFDNYQSISRFEVYILSRDGQLYESKDYCDGH
jgi:hypothetical protein